MMKVYVIALTILAVYAAAEGSMPTVDMLPEDEELVQAKADEEIPILELTQSESEKELSDVGEEDKACIDCIGAAKKQAVTFRKDDAFSNGVTLSRAVLGDSFGKRAPKDKYNSFEVTKKSNTELSHAMAWKSDVEPPNNIEKAIAGIEEAKIEKKIRTLASGHAV